MLICIFTYAIHMVTSPFFIFFLVRLGPKVNEISWTDGGCCYTVFGICDKIKNYNETTRSMKLLKKCFN